MTEKKSNVYKIMANYPRFDPPNGSIENRFNLANEDIRIRIVNDLASIIDREIIYNIYNYMPDNDLIALAQMPYKDISEWALNTINNTEMTPKSKIRQAAARSAARRARQNDNHI